MRRNNFSLKKILYKVLRKKQKVMQLDIDYYRSEGIEIGENFRTFSNLYGAEPYLLSFGHSVTISSNVTFITHDNSISKIIESSTDIFGKIKIGDDCFIGHGAIILPGVELGNKVIVGSGSVVTKSYKKGNVIIAGNPAKIICTTKEFGDKAKDVALNTIGLGYDQKKEMLLNLPNNKFLSK